MINESDFRTFRRLLNIEEYATIYWDEIIPEKNPIDQVDENTWSSITKYSDDVSIRTSTHHGTELRMMVDFWASLYEYYPDDYRGKPIEFAMLDSADELQNSILTLTLGLYRTSASCLRNAIELAVAGTYYSCLEDRHSYLKWKNEEGIIKFDKWCGKISSIDKIRKIENYLQEETSDSLFKTRNKEKGYQGGWIRRFHSELSNFIHSKPGYHDSDFRKGSFGPLYLPYTFRRISSHYGETVTLLYVLKKIADPCTELPIRTRNLLSFSNYKPSKLVVSLFQQLWGSKFDVILSKK